jgi:serine protease AprX
MLKRVSAALALLACMAFALPASAATLGPSLQSKIAGLADAAPAGTVIVTFDTTGGLQESHLDVLRGLGVTKGIKLERLGMVAFDATAGQVRALAQSGAVRSVWANERLQYFDREARTLGGVERLRADAAFTRSNGGFPVNGKGDFSVVVNDSGIDATHPDLQLGRNVIQNVQILTDTDTLSGFTSLQAVENLPDTDLNVGHGTHCAGIVAGTGQQSGTLYAGVAPGAKLVGTGSGAVLFILNGLGGFEYALANQALYGVRVITNSWGGSGAFNPDNPINVASKLAHDHNIVVLFAAGNSGPGRDSHNPYAKAPWVISVGAGTKEGGLASFSSRGVPKSERLADSDPNNDHDAPTLVAPGTGREFESNAAKFSAAYVSTRSKTNMFSNGLTDDAELSPAYLPYYTQISGTSMATPYVAGVVALMLDADPTLSASEIKDILVRTASRMPGYDEWEVGAGYVNAYAAVDQVFNRAKRYGQNFDYTFNARYTVSGPAPERVTINYNPTALPGPGSPNSHQFTVEAGMSVLDVFATFDSALNTGDGNTIGILLTDPQGVKYSSGIALPILDGTTRQVVVKNPAAGRWLMEVRGVRGLAAVPNFSLPTSGAALPGPVNATIKQQLFTLEPVADIQGHPWQAQIESVLKNRMMDTFADGTFRPDTVVTREDFARLLHLNTPLRQTLGASPRFTDVTPEFGAVAEAVTAKGSTLRDWNFVPEGMMSATGSTFNPAGSVNRLDAAVALVRALGLDAEARQKAGTTVTVMVNGVPTALTDNAEIPLALRGYVQLALDRGLFAYFPAEARQVAPGQFVALPGPRFEPATELTRGGAALALDNYRARFVLGN